MSFGNPVKDTRCFFICLSFKDVFMRYSYYRALSIKEIYGSTLVRTSAALPALRLIKQPLVGEEGSDYLFSSILIQWRLYSI